MKTQQISQPVWFAQNRTTRYKFSTLDRQHPLVQALRAQMKGTGYYVKLQGRGPRGEAKANGYRWTADQSLPLRFAKHFDVYVYKR
jgi:uncharacterized caspase-like protein